MELVTMMSNVALKSVFNCFKDAYSLYAEHRVKQFLNTLFSEIEDMDSEE